MTLVSNLSPRILRILARPDSTSLRMAGVISYCLPVYSTFIERPPGIVDSTIWAQTTATAGVADTSRVVRRALAGGTPALLFHSALVGTRDAHVLAVFRNRAASDLDALRLKDAGDLLVGQRPGGIFFFDQLLDAPLEDQQRGVAALGPLHAFGEEVPQFEHALGRVGVLVGHRAADGGGMHADFFGHLLDHHGLQMIDALFQKLLLARHDGIADFHDGLLALLDVLDQLDGALVALFHVVARVFVVGEQALIGGVEPELGHVLVVHQAQPLVAVFDEGHVGLDQARGDLVVAQAGAGIEGADEIQRRRDGLQGTADRLGNLLVLFHLYGAQMVVDNRQRVGNDLRGAVAVVLRRVLRLNVAQLIEQALAQVAAGHARRVHLADHLQRFLQLLAGEARLIPRLRGGRGGWSGGLSGDRGRRHRGGRRNTAQVREAASRDVPAGGRVRRRTGRRGFLRIRARADPERLRRLPQALLGGGVFLRRRGRGDAHQLVIAGNEVTVFVQVADDQFGGLAHSGTERQRAQLPHQVVGQRAGLGQKILERRALDVFHFARAAVAGIQIVLEERAKIDLVERIFLFFGGEGSFFGGGGRSGAVACFLAAAHFVDEGNGIFQFFENRVLHHLGVDHVLELDLVERKDRNHLDQARGEDLALRQLDVQFVLQHHHGACWFLLTLRVSAFQRRCRRDWPHRVQHRPGLQYSIKAPLRLRYSRNVFLHFRGPKALTSRRWFQAERPPDSRRTLALLTPARSSRRDTPAEHPHRFRGPRACRRGKCGPR